MKKLYVVILFFSNIYLIIAFERVRFTSNDEQFINYHQLSNGEITFISCNLKKLQSKRLQILNTDTGIYEIIKLSGIVNFYPSETHNDRLEKILSKERINRNLVETEEIIGHITSISSNGTIKISEFSSEIKIPLHNKKAISLAFLAFAQNYQIKLTKTNISNIKYLNLVKITKSRLGPSDSWLNGTGLYVNPIIYDKHTQQTGFFPFYQSEMKTLEKIFIDLRRPIYRGDYIPNRKENSILFYKLTTSKRAKYDITIEILESHTLNY